MNQQNCGMSPEPVLKPAKQHGAEPRHSSRCSICSHPQRRTIERTFLNKTMSVRDIHKKFGVGHDAMYRHAHALNLLATRNRNWRAPVIPDNSAEVTTEANEKENSEKAVLHVEKQVTPYARDMIELLLLEPDNDLVCAIEEAIEAKVRESGLPIDHAANQIYIAGALTKIKRAPPNWPTWFRSKGYEDQV